MSSKNPSEKLAEEVARASSEEREEDQLKDGEAEANDENGDGEGEEEGDEVEEGKAKKATEPKKTPRSSKPKKPKHSGHQTFTPGDWSPSRPAAAKVKLHSATQGGILGNQADGVYSIVANSDNGDADQGEIIFYGDHTTKQNNNEKFAINMNPLNNNPEPGQPNSQRLVRVIRGSALGSDWAPSAGFRYDGLYEVKHHQLATEAGTEKQYDRYELHRVSNERNYDISLEQSFNDGEEAIDGYETDNGMIKGRREVKRKK